MRPFSVVILMLLTSVATMLLDAKLQKEKVVVKEKLTLVLCKDGDCWDLHNFIAPESVVIPAINKYGHPKWMKEIFYDPDNPPAEEAEKWE